MADTRASRLGLRHTHGAWAAVLLALLVAGGCQVTEPAESRQFDRLWQASQDALTEHGFAVLSQDVASGVITARRQGVHEDGAGLILDVRPASHGYEVAVSIQSPPPDWQAGVPLRGSHLRDPGARGSRHADQSIGATRRHYAEEKRLSESIRARASIGRAKRPYSGHGL